MLEPFRNEPYSDFGDPEVAAAFGEALDRVRRRLGMEMPLVIGEEEVATSATIVSVDPSEPSRVVGVSASAGPEHVDRALEAAWRAFAGWSRRDPEERARLVHRVGDALAARKYELAAWQTFEAGKNWTEAEADVAEAIDFCHYYAHQALRWAEPVPVAQHPGEFDESWYEPLGAGAVVPPWNFPLAILVGMAMGPVAAGNTVVVKPASHTPLVAWGLIEALREAGMPDGVVNLVPGPGSVVGDALVDHPRTRFVNFTGSKEVGLRIAERSARVRAGQRWLKRAYLEMGGKDPIIVDDTADLDAAAEGVVASAYGFQGQKCSACSRLIVFDAVHDELVDRVVTLARSRSIGPAWENHPLGPVISGGQHAMILREIERGRGEGRLVTGGRPVDLLGGWYLEPTVFVDVAPDARLAQFEIFGPVLAVLRVGDLDEALVVANGTEYGLTGGIYSSDEDAIDRVKRELRVGNLYVNRKITGALVGVHPFGGFDMSGSNAKAGGPDYLRLFLEMKSYARRR